MAGLLGPADLTVGEHDLLGRAGRPRGVDDHDDLVGGDGPPARLEGGTGAPGERSPAREQGVEAEHPRLAREGLGALEEDELAHPGDLAADPDELLGLGRALDEGQHGLGVIDDVGDLGWGESLVEGDGDPARMGHAEVGDVVLLACAREERDGLARLEPQIHQAEGGGAHALPVLAPGHGSPGPIPLRQEGGVVPVLDDLFLEQ